jgi:hypothetical protein
MLTKEELEALDNWRFRQAHAQPGRRVRELLKRGLAAEGFDMAEGGSKSRISGYRKRSHSPPTAMPAGRRRPARIAPFGLDFWRAIPL